MGNTICFILLFAFFTARLCRICFFCLVPDPYSHQSNANRVLLVSSCPFFRLFNFAYTKYFLCFHLHNPRFLCVKREFSPLFVSRLFFSIFYMQIEFSSILIGFLIGYTCVYIRTSRLGGSSPRLNCSPPSIFTVFICKNI